VRPDWEEAVSRDDAEALRALLERGYDVDAKDRHGQTALMRLARVGAVDAVRVLLDAGAQLDHTAKYRLSALMLAALNGHEEVVRLLLEAGADTQLRGSGAPGFHEKTALDLAEHMGNEAIAQRLREASGPA
jgi:ankyrin repeat protein